MDYSNEDIVTNMLVNNEIIKIEDVPELFRKEVIKYNSNPAYDLTGYLIKPHEPVQSKFGSKYKFIGVEI